MRGTGSNITVAKLLQEPEASASGGLLCARHFQVAYATNDIDRACQLFRDRLGIGEFRRLEGENPSGGHIRVELAWSGGTMIELMEARGPGHDHVSQWVRADAFAIRHHHLGYLVATREEWDAIRREVSAKGWSIAHENDSEGFMRHCFVFVPELGHYLEYILPEPAGLDFFRSVPAS